MTRKHTLASCLASAQRYQTRSTWAAHDRAAYMAAKKYGWSEQCMAHMPRWTTTYSLDRCLVSARKFDARGAWAVNDPGSYHAAKHYGWFQICCAHMTGGRKPYVLSGRQRKQRRSKYTLENCMASAARYSTKLAWYRGAKQCCMVARRRGWFEKCTRHMPAHKGARNFESCLASARRFQTKAQWIRGDLNASCYAKSKGWYPACTAHMRSGFAQSAEHDLFTVYAFEFPGQVAYVGVTRDLPARTRAHRSTGLSNGGALKVLESAVPGTLASQRENYWYDAYLSRGFTLKNKVRPGSLGTGARKHTRETCLAALQLCQSKHEFRRRFYTSYATALYRGWYDECLQRAGIVR